MTDGSPTAYEVLGVETQAGHDVIRRAYRRLLRETHPDLGGSSTRFHAVQRAWASIETPELRRAYDLTLPRRLFAGGPSAAEDESSESTDSPTRARTTRPEPAAPPRRTPTPATPMPAAAAPRARSYGHPGGEARSRYFALLHEWAGRGATVENPYDAALLRSAPLEIRQWLAKALAEEATATIVGMLGPEFTIWNDVSAGSDGILDHVVLGPSGAYALSSEDWGADITVVRGEIESSRLEPGAAPAKWFSRRVKAVTRSTGVRFAGSLIVVPDGALAVPLDVLDRKRSGSIAVIRRELLPAILSSGAPDWGIVAAKEWGTDQLFNARESLLGKIRLV